jgi:hypothetical protein
MIGSLIGIIASSGGAAAAAGDYESIATVTVGGGGSSSVSFTSIPSTYQHLQIRCITKIADTAPGYGAFAFQFNSDTGSNYVAHQLGGNGAATFASFTSASTSMTVGYTTVSATGFSNVFTSTVVDLLDYANTNKYKTMRSLSGNESNNNDTNSRIRLGSGLWLNTGAISSIVISDPSSAFTQYTQFALYGIKG